MPKKPSKKKPPKKTAGKARKTASRRPPKRKTGRSPGKKPARPSSSSTGNARLRKSVARKAIRSAVAKRSMKKGASRKKAAPRPRPSAAKRAPSGKASRKRPSAAKAPRKKQARKAAPKRASPKKRATASKAPSPKSKAERLGKEFNRAEILEMLSDRYTRHLVIESGGEYALEIIRGFTNNSSDEDMAKKLKIKISDVRATLNKLHSLGIVDYTRHKDSETGWFSYYWFLDTGRMREWVNKRIAEDHRKMDFSKGEHYYCPGCGGASIHDFVSASDFGFRCPSCSSPLDYLSEEKANELFPMRSFRKPLL
jgi:transcription factor E